MSEKIAFLDAGEAVDVGPHGYSQRLVVYRNDPADAHHLEEAKVTRGYAELALSAPHHLVGVSSNPDGTGAWQVLLIETEVAARYPIGTEVTMHYRKDKEIGFGSLVAITSDPVMAPSP